MTIGSSAVQCSAFHPDGLGPTGIGTVRYSERGCGRSVYGVEQARPPWKVRDMAKMYSRDPIWWELKAGGWPHVGHLGSSS